MGSQHEIKLQKKIRLNLSFLLGNYAYNYTLARLWDTVNAKMTDHVNLFFYLIKLLQQTLLLNFIFHKFSEAYTL